MGQPRKVSSHPLRKSVPDQHLENSIHSFIHASSRVWTLTRRIVQSAGCLITLLVLNASAKQSLVPVYGVHALSNLDGVPTDAPVTAWMWECLYVLLVSRFVLQLLTYSKGVEVPLLVASVPLVSDVLIRRIRELEILDDPETMAKLIWRCTVSPLSIYILLLFTINVRINMRRHPFLSMLSFRVVLLAGIASLYFGYASAVVRYCTSHSASIWNANFMGSWSGTFSQNRGLQYMASLSALCIFVSARKRLLNAAILLCPLYIFAMFNDTHGFGRASHDNANKILNQHGFTLLNRQEWNQEYISVMENNALGYRVMRADHSLLGGNWLRSVEPVERDFPAPDPVFSVFTMMESVRLVEQHNYSALADAQISQQHALVMYFWPFLTATFSAMRILLTVLIIRGLGVGTAPAALTMHSIHTTVFEINPVVVDFAFKYFSLPAAVNVVTGNALDLVAEAVERGDKYDFIIHDVFTGGVEPEGLFEQKFLARLYSLLSTNGVLAINYAGDLASLPLLDFLSANEDAANAINVKTKDQRREQRMCRTFTDLNDTAYPDVHVGGNGSLMANLLVICATGDWRFRHPVEADFLGSESRKQYLVPTNELMSLDVDLRSFREDREECLGGICLPNTASTRMNFLQRSTYSQARQRSAKLHWQAMRQAIPAIVWETW